MLLLLKGLVCRSFLSQEWPPVMKLARLQPPPGPSLSNIGYRDLTKVLIHFECLLGLDHGKPL